MGFGFELLLGSFTALDLSNTHTMNKQQTTLKKARWRNLRQQLDINEEAMNIMIYLSEAMKDF